MFETTGECDRNMSGDSGVGTHLGLADDPPCKKLSADGFFDGPGI